MAGSISMWGASQVLGGFFGGFSERPTDFYVALTMSNAPDAFMAGSELDEPDPEAGYARLQISNSPASFTSDFEQITNAAEFIFLPATADWGTVRYWALCDAEINGNFYFFGDLGQDVEVLATDETVIPVNTLNFTVGPLFAGIFDGS